jgi:hypothetical protein
VVVRVKPEEYSTSHIELNVFLDLPLLHLASGDIDAVGLTAAAHREEDVEGGEALVLVPCRNGVESNGVLKDMVVESEVATV